MRFNFLSGFLGGVLAVSAVFLPAVHAETDAELMASGQWRDPDTGLIWMRCSIGQTWTGTTCTGQPIELNWQNANDYFSRTVFNAKGFAGHTNWRLPNIEELSSIRRCSTGWKHEVKEYQGVEMIEIPTAQGEKKIPFRCNPDTVRPTLDHAIFPNTPFAGWYWSASPSAHYVSYAWFVSFGNGYSVSYLKDGSYHVRAVRAGQ